MYDVKLIEKTICGHVGKAHTWLNLGLSSSTLITPRLAKVKPCQVYCWLNLN